MEKKTTMKKWKELKRKVDTKQKRKEPVQCNPDKSVSFQRLWSFEDEIVLLKGIKIFEKVEIPPGKEKQKADLFFKFIKDDIHCNVSKIQLKSKISKLKDTFVKNMIKNKCTFDNLDKQNLYDLSKLI
ncbi:transcription factor [Salix suchowensis]|nr:transcription factor [Salix suchowensis]